MTYGVSEISDSFIFSLYSYGVARVCADRATTEYAGAIAILSEEYLLLTAKCSAVDNYKTDSDYDN